ncbi:hypothetical protein CcaverHIS002_0107510 [Cutaneotrichosporon cavernicola]|uniref:CUE domain-containing protein n=1 Tax=Cutaneotrichosporon cavernicola TaxID=279322 RepID=A0AA48L247_9TREE|nr:uncharacterized protein CcaverHIS019_0107460 [Cutaneotrichosporon cavernicola]BEI80222.1 hypothetical protein CcaverHIS002_0107510 [Cutaneotrichosporon cavernicola]BEI88028.1 hypothetical protein CcaverHIS019_0107460 [Cutaneotrichosporon cavernicola]BEI95801.1 hypothetical protein CcaverHIS631_0107500 [Cutaneotrichosporon cavernicola]BEJ03574.1 hypothetical protein CcaverHIS641_0107490 [Cutaneotrichosporon cavernicola]
MAFEDVLPTLILLGILYAVYRWISGPSTPPDPFSDVRRDMVEAVTSAFPNEPINNVVYSLTRTRSAQVTSELILERGSLPNPPANFTIPDHLRPPVAVPHPSATAPGAEAPAPQKATSLIDRYGLSARLEAEGGASTGKWEATREGREADLRARKERMVLEARRRMLEKQQKSATSSAASSPAPTAASPAPVWVDKSE